MTTCDKQTGTLRNFQHEFVKVQNFIIVKIFHIFLVIFTKYFSRNKYTLADLHIRKFA